MAKIILDDIDEENSKELEINKTDERDEAFNFFDFLDEKDVGDSVLDLVIVTNNNFLDQWIEKFNFMKLNYLIINSELNLKSDSILYIKGNMNKDNFWKLIYNKYKSYNYLILGDSDTPDNFELFYLDFIDSQNHVNINNSVIYEKFNKKFSNISSKIDVPGSNYIIFKSSYLKFILKNKNKMPIRHRLISYRIKYSDKIKSEIVEFMGANTLPSFKDKMNPNIIKLSKYKLSPLFLLALVIIIKAYLKNDMDYFINVTAVTGFVLLLLILIDINLKGDY